MPRRSGTWSRWRIGWREFAVAAALTAALSTGAGATAALTRFEAVTTTAGLSSGTTTMSAAFGRAADGTPNPATSAKWSVFGGSSRVDWGEIIDPESLEGKTETFMPSAADYEHLAEKGFVNIPIQVVLHTAGNRVIAPSIDMEASNWNRKPTAAEPRWAASSVADPGQCAPDVRVEPALTWNDGAADNYGVGDDSGRRSLGPVIVDESQGSLEVRQVYYSEPVGSGQGRDVTLNLCLRGFVPDFNNPPACNASDAKSVDFGDWRNTCTSFGGDTTLTYRDYAERGQNGEKPGQAFSSPATGSGSVTVTPLFPRQRWLDWIANTQPVTVTIGAMSTPRKYTNDPIDIDATVAADSTYKVTDYFPAEQAGGTP